MPSVHKLVLVAQDFPPTRGGIQTYAHELSRVWAQRCRDFRVLAPATAGAREWGETQGLDVRRMRGGEGVFFAAVAPELAGLGPTWCTFHTQWYSALGALALRRCGRLGPVFVAAHGRELLLQPWAQCPLAQRAYDAWRRYTLSHADHVFAVSRYTAQRVVDITGLPKRVSIRANGTDPDYFAPGDRERARRSLFGTLGNATRRGSAPQEVLAGEPLFLSVARLVPRKGVARVVRALGQVLRSAPRARLLIVGEGPERGALESTMRELGLEGQVLFCGALDAERLRLCYQAADVFVLPATSDGADVEGFGIVFLEANACGLPVIGPDRGGPADAIVDGVTGLCVDPSSVAALTAAMARLALDVELRRSLGVAGRQRVLDEFRWSHVAERLLTAIERECPR
jgi:phosphatidyl-myo-inositol dimannoside synthase